ncbi:MAG: putative acetyltransferase EpsM [Chlamydiae bacterium]|nr:putative acetyltransferase EpsM [Chlamydiota bacterium]
MARKLVIFGVGDMARLSNQYFLNSSHKTVAFSTDKEFYIRSFEGLPVILADELTVTKWANPMELFIAVGYKNMRARVSLFERFKQKKVSFATYISPDACLHESVEVGDNCFIMPGVVIEAGVKIGDNNIIWSNATICHNTQIGSHNFIAANTTIGGYVNIEDNCFFGFSSVVLQNLNVQSEVLVGANSVLTTSAFSHQKYLGQPAKIKGNHALNGICV